MTDNFICTWGDTEYALHGPFATLAELKAYGSWWQTNCGDESGDDPRWISVYLTDPYAQPHIDEPSDDLWAEAWAHYDALEAEADRVREQEAREAGIVSMPPPRLIVRGYPSPRPRPNYLLLFEGGYSLFGPIPSAPDAVYHDAISVWGAWWEKQHDSWNWQSLYLADPSVPPRVITPDPSMWPEIWQAHEDWKALERGGQPTRD
jgi:hypothetical protein